MVNLTVEDSRKLAEACGIFFFLFLFTLPFIGHFFFRFSDRISTGKYTAEAAE